MQRAESLILLINCPSFFTVKSDLDTILCVSPMIHGVIDHYSVFDFTLDSHLEEVISTIVIQIL